MSVRSAPGAGTTVSVHLPVTAKRPAPAAAPAEPRELPRTGAERVLVIDDADAGSSEDLLAREGVEADRVLAKPFDAVGRVAAG